MRRDWIGEYGAALLVVPLAVLVWLVWAWGEVAGRLVSGEWPSLPPEQLAAVLVALPSSLSDPAAAWPSADAALLPGPVGMYGVLALLAGPPAGAGAWLVRVLVRREAARRRRRDVPEAWASKRELATLLVRHPEPGRLLLGQAHGRWVAAEPGMSAMVIAPTQMGKTTRIVIPNVRLWQGPAVVTSVKSDVLLATIEDRRRQGPVYVFDPTGLTGMAPAKWSPLVGCEEYAHAERVAAWLADAAEDDGPQTNRAYWETLGRKLLAPLLYAAASFERPIADVARWVNTRAELEVTKLLEALGEGEALQAWAATCAREARSKDAVYGTAEVLLSSFASPSVRDLTTVSAGDASIFDVSSFCDRGGTLYLVGPESELRRLRPLFEALIQSVWRQVERRYLAAGRVIDPAVLFMIDEAAHVAALRHLDLMASTGVGLGAALCTVWQDLAQVDARYGARSATVWNNHRAKLLLGAQSDLRTLEAFTRTAGDARASRETRSAQGASFTATDCPIAPAETLRTLPKGKASLFYGNLPPAEVGVEGFPDGSPGHAS